MTHLIRLLRICLVSASTAAVLPGAPALLWARPQPPAAPAKPEASALYKDAAGPFTVHTTDEDWADTARHRTLPVRIYIPSSPPSRPAVPKDAPDAPKSESPTLEKLPVIIFSPGLGASRISYGYFARHLASHGYLVVVLSHPGSDTAAAVEWVRSHGGARTGQRLAPSAEDDAPGGWLMTSINDPDNLRERPRDISFLLDHIPQHKTLAPIADMSRIGVAGHFFGAYTAMAIGGMTVNLPESHGGKAQSFFDKRVKAVLPMSPEGAGSMGIVAGAWDNFKLPVLFLTGTRDYGSGGRSANWRRQAFDAVHGVDAYLITLGNAGHLTFGNPGGLAGGAEGKHHEALIDSLGTAFFDAYTRDDAKAKSFLTLFSMPKRADCIAQFKPAATDKPDAKP